MSSMSMLQALLVFSFGSSVDQVPDRLVEFEALIIRYALSDAIKKAVLVHGCPEPLKTYLQMNVQTYQSYSSIRNAVQSYTEAKRTWRSEAAQASCRTDMEVDAVSKDGYKGKSKGGNGKSKTPKGDECYICGRRGHGQKDCWHKDTKGNKGKDKVKGKGNRKAKARTRTTQSLK